MRLLSRASPNIISVDLKGRYSSPEPQLSPCPLYPVSLKLLSIRNRS